MRHKQDDQLRNDYKGQSQDPGLPIVVADVDVVAVADAANVVAAVVVVAVVVVDDDADADVYDDDDDDAMTTTMMMMMMMMMMHMIMMMTKGQKMTGLFKGQIESLIVTKKDNIIKVDIGDVSLNKKNQRTSVKYPNTCIGVLSEESSVNPTISLKQMDTSSKFSASTLFPFFSCSATGLFKEQNKKFNCQTLTSKQKKNCQRWH